MFNSLINRLPFLTRSAIGFTLMATPLFALAILAGVLFHQHTAYANTADGEYEMHIELYCPEDVYVEEGDDFRLYVRALEGSDRFSPTMKVFWYTDPGTADESDYSPLHGERQASNGYQTRTGYMGRTFHTTEDNITEQTESFTVRFENVLRDGFDGSCPVFITDDD